MNDIDALLHAAGEGWRATQPSPSAIEPARFTAPGRPGAGSRSMATAVIGIAAVGLVAAVAAVQLGRSPGVGGPPPDGPTPGPSLAEVSAAVSPPTASPSASVACEVTKPTEPFVPPEGYPTEPPPAYGSDWYGTPVLWTMLDRDGETWANLPSTPDGLSQKTFWWSTDWVPEAEPQPNITVVGTRLDAPGSFTVGPGTNASADFGTAMLVGVTVPDPGCWRLTGTYLDASLTIVVLVEGD